MDVIKNFLNYCELNTKLASLFPLVLTVIYGYYVGYPMDLGLSALFFVAMALFDMSGTMINNHIDRKQDGKPGYFSYPVEIGLIFLFVGVAMVLGIYLALQAGLVFLLVGMLGFAAGIGYTFGPFPISRSPYSEVVSMLILRLGVPFLVLTLNGVNLITINFMGYVALVTFNVIHLGQLLLMAMPLMFGSSIVLANNICDYEADLKTRYTMVRHIGVKNALKVYAAFIVVAYLSVAVAVVLRVLPYTCLFIWLTIPLVVKNTKLFFVKQVKSETFVLSVKNFVLIQSAYVVTLLLGLWLKA